ncbi:MAG: cation diffusion facilitator family transporter [Deinococcus-Thermus bacterium]|nr:cation diffusion facilitator family transporter [Deinococcota bacterium]
MRGAEAARAHRRAATVSLVGAVVVLVLKTGAWLTTGSVGLASDAAESIVNVVAGVTLVMAVRLARTPPDFQHPYGHQKVEDLSSAFEAGLILLAAVLIAGAAIQRLIDPTPLVRLGPGLAVAAASAALNGSLAAWLWRRGWRLDSAALRANARHLATDVWTSAGVLVGVGLVAATGVQRLDPVVALVVAAHIAFGGVAVLRRAVSRLMDERLPESEEARVQASLAAQPGILGWHRLRSRRSGRARFVEVDVFVEPTLSVREAHDLVARAEDEIHAELPDLVTTIHVEPHEPGRREGATDPRDEFPPG